MEEVKRVIFFSNGNTAVTDGRFQISGLQHSWFLLFVDFLVQRGVDPLEVEFQLPDHDNRMARVFKTPDGGYNWRFQNF